MVIVTSTYVPIVLLIFCMFYIHHHSINNYDMIIRFQQLFVTHYAIMDLFFAIVITYCPSI